MFVWMLGGQSGHRAHYIMHMRRRDFCFTRFKCSWTIYTEENTLSVGSLAINVQRTRVFKTISGAQGSAFSDHKQKITNDSLIKELLGSVLPSGPTNVDLSESINIVQIINLVLYYICRKIQCNPIGSNLPSKQ